MDINRNTVDDFYNLPTDHQYQALIQSNRKEKLEAIKTDPEPEDARYHEAVYEWGRDFRPSFVTEYVSNTNEPMPKTNTVGEVVPDKRSVAEKKNATVNRVRRINIAYAPVSNKKFLASQVFEGLKAHFYDNIYKNIDKRYRINVTMQLAPEVGDSITDRRTNFISTTHIHMRDLEPVVMGGLPNKAADDFWASMKIDMIGTTISTTQTLNS
jgi:hypothetical protein